MGNMVGKKNVVLVLDKSEADTNIIKAMLIDEYDVIVATNTGEAFSMIRKSKVPKVIICGTDLANDSGFNFMSMLKSTVRFENIPFIFITQKRDIETEIRCIESEAVGFLEKPINKNLLMAYISQALKQSVEEMFIVEHPNKLKKDLDIEHEKYQQLTEQMLLSITSAIDAKDKYTRGHSSRVAKFSCTIGSVLGLTYVQMETLSRCAILHDVGKIGMPDEILRKTEKLTAEEFDYIKKHPVTGYEILHGITAMPELAQVARWHHERYDGDGYPDRIAGESIPLFARIVTIADSFDAMISDRCYHKAMSISGAKEELIKNSGTQFDPELIEIAVKHLAS